MDLWQVIVGIFSAALLIFFRNAHVTAQKQKVIATRLRSYLLYWNGWILDNDMFDVFYLGVEWNKQIQETIKKGGGAKDLVKLKEEKKKMVDEIKEMIESEADPLKFDKETIVKALNKLPSITAETILQLAMKSEQNLLDGKTFISDEDASYLGIYFAQICVEMKMNLISMMSQGVGLILKFMSDSENFDLKVSAKELSQIIWKAVLVSKDIDTLTNRINVYTENSLFNLTLKNMSSRL
ncbi:MAG: hypothetical protein L6406_20300 [Desulfobacterales bacterium]|nr:hypothetical protein [Desulfobacterales bacterium]